jgi:hypothetical protein
MATPNIVPQADQEGGLGTSAKSWGKLFIENPTSGGTAAVTISNLDVDKVALDINANNTTANVLDITSTALTTGSLAAFTGTATPADGASNTLVNFIGTFSGVGTSTLKGAFLDVNKGAVTASGKTAALYGMHIDLDDTATNVGTVNSYGLMVNNNFTSTGGTVNAYGIHVTAAGGDSNYDLYLGSGSLYAVGDFTLGMGPNNGAVLTRRKFSITSTTDGNHDGDIVYFGATESLTTGAIYHYKSDGTWEAADADAASTSDGLLAVALGENSDESGMLLRGMVTIDHDPGAVGDVLYLSTTAGDCSATAPSGTGDIVRIIGYCLDASNGQIWFNPDSTFVEIS